MHDLALGQVYRDRESGVVGWVWDYWVETHGSGQMATVVRYVILRPLSGGEDVKTTDYQLRTVSAPDIVASLGFDDG